MRVPSPAAIAEQGEALISQLIGELATVTAENATLAELIAETDDERRAEALLRAVSLPARAATLKNLLAAARLLHDVAKTPAAAGKKQTAAAAAGQAAKSGRFATPAAPKLVVDNA